MRRIRIITAHALRRAAEATGYVAALLATAGNRVMPPPLQSELSKLSRSEAIELAHKLRRRMRNIRVDQAEATDRLVRTLGLHPLYRCRPCGSLLQQELGGFRCTGCGARYTSTKEIVH